MTRIQQFALWGTATLLTAVIFAPQALAQQREREYQAREVEVLGTRPTAKTPVTQQRIKADDLRRSNIAWDVPSLLLGTPSLFVTSDGGIMGGYTAFSIRGVDATRVNITNMGIPLNDSESQTVFWANMPDYSSRLDDIVIVRGAGSSTFGAGSFGATMDMRSRRPSNLFGGMLAAQLGSYGMRRYSLSLESGRLGKSGWALSAAGSKIDSKGYIDRSGTNGYSYLGHASYRGENISFDLIHNQGNQKTGIAWNGLEEWQEYMGRTFNSAGLINPDEAYKDPQSAKYHYNTDNYRQGHTYAIFKHALSPNLTYGITLHYTRGFGFTNEYRTGRRMREYGLAPMDVKTKTNLIRNKYLDNHFYGGVATIEYRKDALRITSGAAGNRYTNKHFGTIDFVKDAPANFKKGQEYYRNNSVKLDLSAYIKAEYDISRSTTLFADVMYRHINHKMHGPTDKYDRHTKTMDVLDYDLNFNFVLPKLGIYHAFTPNVSAYTSVAMAGKEPGRDNFTDSKSYVDGVLQLPRPEYMIDYELGIQGSWSNVTLGVNGYFMGYKDQLVLNGAKSDVGESILINVPKSYRAGIETSLAWHLLPNLFVQGNLTVSTNKIIDFDLVEYDENEENPQTHHLKSTPIAQSPAIIANHILGWSPIKPVQLLFTGNYVSKRHLDNSGLECRTLPGYYVGNFKINVTLPFAHRRNVVFNLQANNLFNKEYASNGWLSGYTDSATGERKAWKGIYPSAPLHFIGGVTINF